MTGVDVAIAIGIGLFILSGFVEGLIKKIIGLLVLILAFYIALHTHPIFSRWMQDIFTLPPLFSKILAFLILFIFVLVAGNVLYRTVGSKEQLFKTWDRMGGSVFGFVEGAIIVSIVLHLLSLVDYPSEQVIARSVLYPLVYSFAPMVFEALYIFIPQVRDFFDIFIRDVDVNSFTLENLPCSMLQSKN